MANHEQIMTSGGGGGANRDAAKKIGHEIVQMAQIQSSKNYTCLPVVAPPNGPQIQISQQPHPHQLQQQQQHQYQQMSHQTSAGGPYAQMMPYPSMPVDNNNPNNMTGSSYEPYGTGNSGLNGNVYENNGNNGYSRMMMPASQMGAQLPPQQPQQQYYNSYAR